MKAGTLVTSVVTYAVCATACLLLLILRRFVPTFGGGELGGPAGFKYGTGIFMIFLWFIYVLISSLVAYDHLKAI